MTETRIAPTRLKLEDAYVLWYSNAARLVVTGYGKSKKNI